MPSTGSRYQLCDGLYDEEGRLYLTEREPYRYRDFPDNWVHTVVERDTLFTLAGKYFKPLPRACGYWWVIADFQPKVIHDPTIRLESGSKLYIVSLRVLNEIVLSEVRRQGFQ